MFERRLFREEHDMFRDVVRKFVAREIAPYHHQWEKDGVVPRDLWLKASSYLKKWLAAASRGRVS
jgi:acyl-CoA dehydrogenase